MAPLSRPAFRTLLEGLDSAEFERFVAGLYRARGCTVADEGDLLVVDGDGAGRRRVWIHHPGRWPFAGDGSPPRAADTVVSSAGSPPEAGDRRVLAADDLHGLAFYGIDRESCGALFVDVFGKPPADLDPRTGSRVAVAAAAAVLLVVVSVAVGAGVQAGIPGGGAPGEGALFGSSAPEDRFTATTAGSDAPATTAVAAERFANGTAATTTTTGMAEFVPDSPVVAGLLDVLPGVGPEGITDTETLARTHADRVVNRSYVIELTYRRFENGSQVATLRETGRVSPDGASTSIRATGNVTGNPALIVDPTPSGAPEEVTPREYAERSETALAYYLDAGESWVARSYQENGTWRFVVRLRGSRSPDETDVTGSAVVDQNGVVHELQRSHRVSGTDTRIVIEIEYSKVSP